MDLRLAESYTPLCMCAAKCAVVCILHTTLGGATVTGGGNDPSSVSDGSMRAHLASATLLILDALVIPYRESIVNTNAVAWAILIAFMSSSSMLPLVHVSGTAASPIAMPMMVVDGGRQQQLLQMQQKAFEPTTTPQHNPTTTEPSPSSSPLLAFMTLLWCVMATAHMTYGGVPLVHSNPSMAFWPAVMMKKSTMLPGRLPPREVVACILTTLMVATTCDHRWHHNLHDRHHRRQEPTPHEDLMAGTCFRSCTYAILSCMWSYTVVALTRPNSSSGSHVAMTTSVLTATRFMPILYMPSPAAAAVWGVAVASWIAWVCSRHMGLSSHPKKHDEDDYHRVSGRRDSDDANKKSMVSLMSELHGLEAAAARSYQNHPTQHHQAPASSCPPPNTTMPSSMPSSMPASTHTVTPTLTHPSTHPSANPSPHEDVSSDLLALQAAKAKGAGGGAGGGVPSTPVAAGMLRLM